MAASWWPGGVPPFLAQGSRKALVSTFSSSLACLPFVSISPSLPFANFCAQGRPKGSQDFQTSILRGAALASCFDLFENTSNLLNRSRLYTLTHVCFIQRLHFPIRTSSNNSPNKKSGKFKTIVSKNNMLTTNSRNSPKGRRKGPQGISKGLLNLRFPDPFVASTPQGRPKAPKWHQHGCHWEPFLMDLCFFP